MEKISTEKMSVVGLRNKLERKIELARKRVIMYEELLKLFDNEMTQSSDPDTVPDIVTSKDNGDGQLSLLAPTASSRGNTLGIAIREMMENANGQFNVPGVVVAVMPSFPDIERSDLSRKASQVANRLNKKGKIKLVKKGAGREPNTYISTKLCGK